MLWTVPPLLRFEKIAGGWSMVVMEFMDNYVPFSNYDKPATISSELRSMLTRLVEGFHNKKFVHGDIRSTNILVPKEGTGELKIKLIDFDWGGLEGRVKYPSAINHVTIPRPGGVVDGALITMAHDREMIAEIFCGLP
jgi:serine/threonine protein kinase